MRKGILMMVWCLGLLTVISAPITAHGEESFKDLALRYAEKFFEGGRVDEGKVYFAPDGRPSAYVFTVYMGKGDFPTQEEILGQVARYRQERLQAQSMLGRR